MSKFRAGGATRREPILPFGKRGRWGFWSGVLGIDQKLNIYDFQWEIGNATEIPAKVRKVIAKHMIELWQKFEAGKTK